MQLPRQEPTPLESLRYRDSSPRRTPEAWHPLTPGVPPSRDSAGPPKAVEEAAGALRTDQIRMKTKISAKRTRATIPMTTNRISLEDFSRSPMAATIEHTGEGRG